MIQIMKASAGSGKTFNLAKTYIRLLFEAKDSHSYRHILAVTFTNKATDEMKGRILKELFVLSVEPEASGYFRDFVPSLAKSPSELKKLAEDLLCNILHDYGAFSVSTIDRFFQQTLKAFSREIGQFASYQVELDKDSLVEESVDRILDSLTENDSALLKWLTDNVLEQIEAGGRYSLDKSLKDMAKRLRSNGHRDQLEKYRIDENELYSKETLERIRKECRSVVSGFYAKVREAASRVLDLMYLNGVDPAESNRKFMSRLHVYAGLKNSDDIPFPTDTFLKNASDHELWFSKAKARTLLPKVYPLIEEPLNDFCALFDAEYRVFSTAKIIDGQLYGLGVAGELNGTFRDLMKEKNVLCLDDSNTILKGIIDGSDAPFVYEKLGVRYEHFLLDEFQDTSRIQWDNFRPLLHNSEAQGFDSLIVGDVKQSIYRWRDSDWNLLDSELEQEFDRVKVDCLQSNYRSLSCIVHFNNVFFPVAARVLDDSYEDRSGRGISEIYSDVEQAVAAKGNEEGSVCLTWCGKDSQTMKVVESISGIRSKGARYGDIAILVRGNAEGESIASFLIDNRIPVVTDDSLKVRSSLVVRRLVSLLSFADNPHDTVGGFLASSLDVTLPEEFHSMIDLAENLLRQLRRADESVFDGETLYVQSFMDFLHDYVSVNGNSLRGFLKHWEDKDPSISSPALGDSVRIMTVHKSKGLDFPYVIFPYAEKVTLYKPSSCWCHPETAGTGLEGLPDGIFDVTLSANSERTLFAEDYRKEKKMQYVDNINILYVAFTRASKGMHIISSAPSQKFLEMIESGKRPEFSDMSQILYWFADSQVSDPVPGRESSIRFRRAHGEDGSVSYIAGELFDFAGYHAAADASPMAGGVRTCEIQAGYPSWPIDGRLLFKTEGADFFADDGRAGVSASHRLRGIVLHDILSCVVVPSDLEGAVANARQAGKLTDSEASEAFALLSGRIGKASARGWFPEDPSMVRNEVSLIDTDGSVYRPDRMVFGPDSGVIIIDYKFGAHRKSYESQVARYADICRRMGYLNVTTALWYVDSDEVR